MSDNFLRLSEKQLSQFPWGGFYEYAQEHPEIQPNPTQFATNTVNIFEAELEQQDKAAILAWGPTGLGKSTTLVPAIEAELTNRGYAAVPWIFPDLAEKLQKKSELPTSDKGLVMVLDEFCNEVLGYGGKQAEQQTVAEYTELLAKSVELLKPVGIICIDARSHHVADQRHHQNQQWHKVATKQAIADALQVPVNEFDIPLEDVTPPPEAVSTLLDSLGFEPEITENFAAKATLRTIILIRNLTDNVAWARMGGNSPFSEAGDEVINADLAEQLLRNNLDEGNGVWYGFRSADTLVAEALGSLASRRET